MNLYVADTHTLFWYFTASPSLGSQAQAAFDEGIHQQALIYIPAIVLAELYFLNEKKSRLIDYSATFALLMQSSQFVLLPFEPIDTLEFDLDKAVLDIHDRMIVGVARRLSAILLTRDEQIVESGIVKTVW
ncbi:MAG: type II toxin-antitoxin system VapC family toxin [Pyrinomonadaceae bacterium]